MRMMTTLRGSVLALALIAPALAMVAAPVQAQQRPPPEDLFTRNNDIRQIARMINVMAL